MKRPTIALAGLCGVALLGCVGCTHKTVIEDHRDSEPARVERERVEIHDHDRDRMDSGRTYERREREETVERR
jgi:hypothetical protein